ncbi:MAG: DUF2029 domain-containing protein [Ruminococcaceae bacterium]|nr:DUF2029 domain-containing protein [Oscillospiraceae bacterium]
MSKNALDERSLDTKRSPDLSKIFIFSVGISAAIFFIVYLIIGNGRFSSAFFKLGSDFYMDFFNSIRDASQGSAVYTERKVIYPPMANLIYLILSRFTPNAYNDTSFSDKHQWTMHFSPFILVLIYSIATALLLFSLIYVSFKKGSDLKRFVFAFAAFFNIPVLFMAERGNIIMVCMIAVMLYTFTYDHEIKFYREIGLIALAFAFSIKLYPVVFGWLLIADKRYKEALRCAIYGLLMLILPSFFFGGPICLVTMLQNVFGFSAGSKSTLSIILDTVGLPSGAQLALTVLIYLWVLICGICFALSPFLKRERWRQWALGFVTILCVPSLTSLYSWAFLLIPMVMLCNLERPTRREVMYMVLMTVPFVFLPFYFTYRVTVSTVIVYVMTALLSITLVASEAKHLVRYLKQRK